MSATTSKLFTPIKVGTSLLGHRAVLAPLTRYRANSAHVHGDLAVEHYEQRGSTPGTLLITEATFIAQRASGYAHVPGIWTDDQVAAWKRVMQCLFLLAKNVTYRQLQVTDAVHKKGSYIYIQLWAIGRAADPKVLKEEDPDLPYVSASDVQLTGKPFPPRPLTVAGETFLIFLARTKTISTPMLRNQRIRAVVCHCCVERSTSCRFRWYRAS